MGIGRHEGRDTFRDLHAEVSILGAILLDNDVIAIVAERLAPSDFWREAHGHIYAAMLTLWQQRRAIDMVTVCDALGPMIDDVGGPVYVGQLIDGMPRVRNIDAYIDIVKTRATRRELHKAVLQAKAAVEDGSLALEEAATITAQVITRSVPRPTVAYASAYGERFKAWIEDDTTRDAGKVFTGITTLDAIHRGGLPVGCTTLGGRTSHGKTAVATSIAHYVGMGDVPEPCMFVSGEMSEREMTARLVALHGRLDAEALIAGDLDYVDKRRLLRATEEVTERSRIAFVDRKMTPSQIRAAATRMHAEQGLRLLIVDYIQIMKADPKMLKNAGGQRHIVLGEMMRAYKDIGDELEIPVLVLAQLARSATAKKRPTNEDLRESGDLEQDSHVIWLLDRHPGNSEGKIYVSKNRNGRVGQADLHFEQQCMRFSGGDQGVAAAARTYAHDDEDGDL